MRTRSLSLVLSLAAAGATVGCLPYPVGAPAQPLPRGETRAASSIYLIPNGISLREKVDTGRRAPPLPLRGGDLEWRTGLDGESDIAVHVASMSGIVIDYKRRIAGDADSTAAATSLLLGGGVVNFGEHAYGEVGIVTSGAATDGRVLYGGLRVMQVAPIVADAVHDTPTAGGFLGFRLPIGDVDFLPEIGAYYDHSALGVRRGDLLIVPSLSVARTRRGSRLAEMPAPHLPTIRPPVDTVGLVLPRRPARGPIPLPSAARPRRRDP